MATGALRGPTVTTRLRLLTLPCTPQTRTAPMLAMGAATTGEPTATLMAAQTGDMEPCGEVRLFRWLGLALVGRADRVAVRLSDKGVPSKNNIIKGIYLCVSVDLMHVCFCNYCLVGVLLWAVQARTATPQGLRVPPEALLTDWHLVYIEFAGRPTACAE